MEKVEKIWLDGEFLPWDEAKVHVLAHGLHYGSSVFEGIRFYKTPKTPAVFRLKEHIDRLYYSAQALEMVIPYTKEKLIEAILEGVRINKIESGYIRPLVFYGYGKMGLNPKGASVNVCIALWPWGAYLGKDTVNVNISKFIRLHPQSVIADAKVSGHYVNSILASQEIHKKGYDEALLLDFNGNVAEGPGENIFMIKDGKMYTVPEGNILPGLTRQCVLEIAEKEGIDCKEKPLSVDEIKNADELFFTGTAAEIQPIAKIDETLIDGGKIGPITKKIQDIYLKAASGQIPEYESWLSYT